MKLKSFEHRGAYQFELVFANGEIRQVDLRALLGEHVAPHELDSARLDSEWGCLEFKGGAVDVEPQTLYRYAVTGDHRRAA